MLSEHAKRAGVGAGDDAVARREAAVWGGTTYTSASDAGDDEVNFHRPAMFLRASLAGGTVQRKFCCQVVNGVCTTKPCIHPPCWERTR